MALFCLVKLENHCLTGPFFFINEKLITHFYISLVFWREEVLRCKIRIRHSNLTHSSHLLDNPQSATGCSCNVQLSIQYLTIQCPDYSNIWTNLNFPSTIQKLFCDFKISIQIPFQCKALPIPLYKTTFASISNQVAVQDTVK